MEIEEQRLEEYKQIRQEILQLNKEAFAVATGSFTINIAILVVNKAGCEVQNSGSQLFFGILILAVGLLLIAHKIRCAHRLSYFIVHFIEPHLKGLQWQSVYSLYRKKYKENDSSNIGDIAERFVKAQGIIIVAIQMVDILILICNREAPWTFGAIILILIQWLCCKHFNDYTHIEKTLRDIASNQQQ
jgi:hypothetical protein